MEIINKNLIFTLKEKISKSKALDEIASTLAKEYNVKATAVSKGLKDREKEISTGLENGIAIPHTVVNGIKEPKVVITKYKTPVEWDSADNTPVDLSIAIFVPEGARDEHLIILGKISTILTTKQKQNEFKKMSVSDMIKTIEDATKVKKTRNVSGKFDVVGVTACPTGVAHTFMAAEAIEKEARARGLTVKIEKQGQSTVDHLSQKEIDDAKYVIFATGRGIDESRFAGKEVLRVPVSEPIKNSKKTIDKLVEGKNSEVIKSSVKTTGGEQRISLEQTMNFDNFGRRAWNGILTGVSYMLPFVVVGGILIAVSFLIDIKNAGDPNYGNINPAADWLKTFAGVSFGLMVPILTAYLMNSIVGRQGIILGFVIGYLAIGSGPDWILVFSYNGWMPDGAGGVAASGFIGGIFGGIMGAAFIIVLDKFWTRILPESLNGAKLLLFLPLSSVLIAGGIFWFFNIPLTFLSWGIMWFLGIFDSPQTIWIFGMIAGALACVDYGGPVNKAAYLFGVATIGMADPAVGSVYMAAVSAACIIPPLGIALATSFGRKTLWDENDISAGLTNWILGATHITEGAIPFATKYPKDVYFQTMIAGSLVGALSAALGIATMAPHGGVLTFALLKCSYIDPANAVLATALGISLYLLVLSIGIVLQASMILFFRKRTVKKESLEA